MKKTILKIAVCALFAAPVLSRGQEATNMAAPAAPAAAAEIPAAKAAPAMPKKTDTSLASTGKAVNVDTNAMTLTVGKRTFDITSETRITKGAKPAILSDIAVDDNVSVTYNKAGRKLNAVTISDGRKSAKADSGTKKNGD